MLEFRRLEFGCFKAPSHEMEGGNLLKYMTSATAVPISFVAPFLGRFTFNRAGMAPTQKTARKRTTRRPAHPEKPSAKRVRKQDHVGAPTWAKGTQFQYLESFLDDWMETPRKSKERGQYVRMVVILFLTKYGWDWADGDKPDAEDPNPEELLAHDQLIAGEGEEQKLVNAALISALQTVWLYLFLTHMEVNHSL